MTETNKILYAGLSDQGIIRADNQDSFGKFPESSLDLLYPKGLLFIVADGMGGHKEGKQASQLAVDTIHRCYFDDDGTDAAESLRRAFRKANEAIYAESSKTPELGNMGTTCSALLLQDNKGIIGHVGDSRIYRIVKNSIEQLTDDHSTVAEMQRRGILTEEEARVHPERSHLYRALGVRPEMEIDVMHDISLGMNELFLLCTDGLVNHVEDDEICRIVLQYRPDGAVRKLVDLANERGGSDNITVEVLHVNPTESFMQRVFNKRP